MKFNSCQMYYDQIRRKWMLYWSLPREFTTEVLKNTKIICIWWVTLETFWNVFWPHFPFSFHKNLFLQLHPMIWSILYIREKLMSFAHIKKIWHPTLFFCNKINLTQHIVIKEQLNQIGWSTSEKYASHHFANLFLSWNINRSGVFCTIKSMLRIFNLEISSRQQEFSRSTRAVKFVYREIYHLFSSLTLMPGQWSGQKQNYRM